MLMDKYHLINIRNAGRFIKNKLRAGMQGAATPPCSAGATRLSAVNTLQSLLLHRRRYPHQCSGDFKLK